MYPFRTSVVSWLKPIRYFPFVDSVDGLSRSPCTEVLPSSIRRLICGRAPVEVPRLRTLRFCYLLVTFRDPYLIVNLWPWSATLPGISPPNHTWLLFLYYNLRRLVFSSDQILFFSVRPPPIADLFYFPRVPPLFFYLTQQFPSTFVRTLRFLFLTILSHGRWLANQLLAIHMCLQSRFFRFCRPFFSTIYSSFPLPVSFISGGVHLLAQWLQE